MIYKNIRKRRCRSPPKKKSPVNQDRGKFLNGAGSQNRTGDPLITNQVHYRLCYASMNTNAEKFSRCNCVATKAL